MAVAGVVAVGAQRLHELTVEVAQLALKSGNLLLVLRGIPLVAPLVCALLRALRFDLTGRARQRLHRIKLTISLPRIICIQGGHQPKISGGPRSRF